MNDYQFVILICLLSIWGFILRELLNRMSGHLNRIVQALYNIESMDIEALQHLKGIHTRTWEPIIDVNVRVVNSKLDQMIKTLELLTEHFGAMAENQHRITEILAKNLENGE